MTDSAKRIRDDVFSLFKMSFPSKVDTKSEADDIIEQIEKAIDLGDGAISDPDLRKIYKTYRSNLGKLAGVSAASPDGSVATIADIASTYAKTFVEIWPQLTGNGPDSINTKIANTVLTAITGASDKAWEALVQSFVNNGFFSQDSADYIMSFIKAQGAGGIVSVIAIAISIISAFTKTASGTMSGDFVKKMNSKFTPNYLDVETLVKALHIAPELSDDINKKLAENGLDESDIKLLKISHYSLYDVNQIRECFLRKIISKEEAINRFSELGFTPSRISEIMQTWNIIPGPQDLFWLVGKEAFEPDQIAKFGLSAEFPQEQVKWLEMQGVSAEWAMKYWIAHWDYPSEGRVLDLYHRGLVTDDELNQFYRLIEITPFWREKLKKASFSLYTRVDLRRMHDMGLITEQEVYDNFRGEGYDDIHAKNMVKFYLKYNEDNNKDLSRSQITNAYKADLITKARAIEMLMAQQYTADQATFMIEMEDYNELIAMQKLRIKTVQKSYKGSYISTNEARRLLLELNVETKWVDFYIKTWDAEIELEEKVPPKEDLLSWLGSGLISSDDFILYMRRLHYSEKTIGIYLKANT